MEWWGRDFRGWRHETRADALAPVQTSLSYYASSKRARAVLGQSRSTIDLPQTLHDGGVLLIHRPGSRRPRRSRPRGRIPPQPGGRRDPRAGESALRAAAGRAGGRGREAVDARRGLRIDAQRAGKFGVSLVLTTQASPSWTTSPACGDLCITRGRWGDTSVPGVVPSPYYLLERNRRVRTSASPLFPGDSTRRFRPFSLLGLGRTKGYPVRPYQVVSHHLEPHLNGIPLQPLVPHPVIPIAAFQRPEHLFHCRPHRRYQLVVTLLPVRQPPLNLMGAVHGPVSSMPRERSHRRLLLDS